MDNENIGTQTEETTSQEQTETTPEPTEKPADKQRVIGGDAVHSETYHCPDILLLVHGPDIH